MTPPLTDEQRQRLAVLYDTWSALHIGELDSWDLIRCAHWVHTGQDMPAAHPLRDTFNRRAEGFGSDAATWNADLS